MIKRIVIFLFAASLFSCSSKNKVPSAILQPKEMKSIMWDVMRAQALAVEISRRDSSVKDSAEIKRLTQRVFELHDITIADFNKSYNWYIKHPEPMSAIFDSLYIEQQRIVNESHEANKVVNDAVPPAQTFIR